MTRLSLVMIIRDAAPLLAEFFRHHRGLWDEAVVVDTGSRDAGPSIATDAGCRLIHHPWHDDFSEPRNVGLEAATGERILLLDADERIAQSDFAAVREAASGSECGWLQETINYCAERSHLEWRPVRGRYADEEAGQAGFFAARRVGLFPRRPDVRFRGRVHESVLASCTTAGIPVSTLDVPVHHYGYVMSRATDERRHHTYLRLAAMKLADDPRDWSARLEHATALLEAGQVAEAEFELAILSDGPGTLRPVARGRFLLGRMRREAGLFEPAGELLEAAVRDDPTFLFGWVELLRLRSGQERWRSVFESLALARGVCGGDEPLLDREELVALIKTGQLAEARDLAGRLADSCPGWREITLLRAKLRLLAGRPDAGG